MVTDSTIKKVAQISRLELSKEEFQKIKSDFNEVLDFFKVLEEADVTDIKEIPIQPIELNHSIENLREDIVVQKEEKEASLKITKHKNDDYFKGPKAF